MVLSSKTALLFTSHIALLTFKIWFVYKLSVFLNIAEAPKKDNFILLMKKLELPLYIISIILLGMEVYYIYCFFDRIIPHSYKYFHIAGGVFGMIYIINTRKKDG